MVNHEDGIYAKGDTVRVWVDVNGLDGKNVTFCVMRYCDWNAESRQNITLREGRTLLFERAFDESVQYVFEITDGVAPRDFKKDGTGNSFAGVVVAPEEFRPGYTQPSDLMKVWKRQIKKMRRQSIRPTVTKDVTEKGYRTYHVEINCVGPASLQAYVSHPADAAEGSLPIILFLHSAGNPGSPSAASTAYSYASSYVKGGALAMDLNAHGMLDDQPQAYYDSLNTGALKGYSSREPSSFEDYYH